MTDTSSHIGLKSVTPGDYSYRIECPECGKAVHAAVTLSAQLTVTDEGGWLRPTMRTKRTEHNCKTPDQPSMLDQDGQVIPLNG